MTIDTLVRITCRRRNLNGRGNGRQWTRRVLLPDGRRGWASDVLQDVRGHWGTSMYSEDRHSEETGMAPLGTIVVEYESTFRGGSKVGRAELRAGRVVRTEAPAIDWGLSCRRSDDGVEVLVDGEWATI